MVPKAAVRAWAGKGTVGVPVGVLVVVCSTAVVAGTVVAERIGHWPEEESECSCSRPVASVGAVVLRSSL